MIAEKLRKSILQAAIQGKLTEQMPEDGDAHNLLAYVFTPQNRNKFEQNPEHFLIVEDEQPVSIPDNWVWIRLGDICEKIGSGSTPLGGRAVYVSAGIKFIRSQNVYNDGLQLENVAYITPEVDQKKAGSHVYAKDILLNITGASIGRCALVPDDFDVANINQHVLILRLAYEKIREYIHLVMTSPYIYGEIMSAQVGGTKEGLSAAKAKQLMIPLPPISEQLRIIDTVNKGLLKIKELEKDELRLDLLQQSFPKKMKDSLLQAAIQGKLIEQLEVDGDARELVTDIQKEKEHLIKEGKIKKEKSLPEITEDEIPFDIPDNWCWVRMDDICFKIGDIDHKMPSTVLEGYPYISPVDFYGKNEINFSKAKKISEKDFRRLSLKIQPEKNDIIFPRYGTIGVLRYIETDIKFLVSYSCATIKPIKTYIDSKYVYFVLQSNLTQDEIKKYVNKTTQPNVGLNSIKKFLIPLPPLAEQQRIVERLEQLLPLCDALE